MPGYTPVCVDDFTTPATLGSWGTQDPSAIVYRGDHGCNWTEYPDGWASTNTRGGPGYEPSQVLSVHDGVLDFHLHPINGHAEGANPSPMLGSSQYVSSGYFSFRAKFASVAGYHSAILLWPLNDNDWESAESDFPEFDLTDTSVSAYSHYGGSGAQDAFNAALDPTQWHTYTQVWSPGKRQYFVDGNLIGTSTNKVYAKTERWQLQIEPSSTAAGGTGDVLIDWVSAGVPS